jgi:acetyl-CoA synthetase
VTVLDYYGLTESYPLVANYPWMEVREGSMGRPMPGWDVQILDEDENPVPQGERGEICLRARSNPHYPLGYWNNEEAARETFGGDWFHTKDAATMDEDGYVWYAGRADDVIISAGYRIGPFEVESACIEHPAVREAAAVASPDERRGHVVKAFIVLAEGHEGSDELAGEISSFVRDRLSQYAYPRRIEFVDDLPKTLTGKIRRIELREREAEKVGAS